MLCDNDDWRAENGLKETGYLNVYSSIHLEELRIIRFLILLFVAASRLTKNFFLC
jgi:hypothetical protein